MTDESRQAIWRRDHKARGLCVGCSRKATRGVYCAGCKPATLGKRRCRRCGKPGHYVKTCPAKRVDKARADG